MIMFFTFLKLQLLKAVRSVSLTRNLVGAFFVGLFVLLIFLYLIGLAVNMKPVIKAVFGSDEPLKFINANILNLFVLEFMYRFFLQKPPAFELAGFLHLPVKRTTIVHSLLIKSVFSPFNIIIFLIFLPFATIDLVPEYGTVGAYSWLATLVFISWILHWFTLYFKTRYGDSILSILVIFLFGLINFLMGYYNWMNPGELLSPFFETALVSAWVPLLVISSSLFFYYLIFSFYYNNAYLEEIAQSSGNTYIDGSLDFFSRFGLVGEFAEAEWKLILRHKKSRNFLLISILFLFYGVIFYGNPEFQSEGSFSYFYIFIGTFVTGIFMIQYGQLFLSWNSQNFDFYMSRPDGLTALIRGKYLLFVMISFVCFLLSVPYVYYGYDVILVHAATFLFNIGVTIHLIINLALWKPKPMDLSKGSFFNYEGVGLAQYLMIIPIVIVPYIVFVPVALIFDGYAGLLALGVIGSIGMIYNEKLSGFAVRRLNRDKYQISTSFRQET